MAISLTMIEALTDWLINPESIDQTVPTEVVDDNAIVAQDVNRAVL